MDTTAQWPQGIGVVKAMEGSRAMNNNNTTKARPQKDQALNCPRCNSTNTKFCYYNNYSLSQPRYFCKTCRRYWTEGGSLRNVPVGGGSRKNKRSSSSSLSSPSIPSSSSKKPVPDPLTPQNPKILEGQDLNLAYPPTHQNPSSTSSTPSHISSAMELLKSTGLSSRALITSFAPVPLNHHHDHHSSPLFSTGLTFPLQDFKPSLNFSLDGFESGYNGNFQGVHESGSARLLFPIEDIKQGQSGNSTEIEQINRGQGDSTGFWSGMLGGGSW